MSHANARWTPAGRLLLVERIEAMSDTAEPWIVVGSHGLCVTAATSLTVSWSERPRASDETPTTRKKLYFPMTAATSRGVATKPNCSRRSTRHTDSPSSLQPQTDAAACGTPSPQPQQAVAESTRTRGQAEQPDCGAEHSAELDAATRKRDGGKGCDPNPPFGVLWLTSRCRDGMQSLKPDLSCRETWLRLWLRSSDSGVLHTL